MTMRSKQWYTKASRSPKSWVNSSIGTSLYAKEGNGGAGKDPMRAWPEGYPWQGFQVGRRNPLHPAPRRRIRRALRHRRPTRAVFDRYRRRLAPGPGRSPRRPSGGDPDPIHFEETDTNFAIGWKGNYSVDGDAFVFIDNDSARIVTFLGYPTGRIAQLG